MKNLLLALVLIAASINGFAQSIAINTNGNVPDPRAILDISSHDRGILIPRMTTGDREQIPSPPIGLLVFDTDSESFWFYSGGWQEIISDNDMGDAGGDLIGQYPEPTVAKLQGHTVSALTPNDKQVLKWDAANTTWSGMNDSLALPYIAAASGPGHLFSVTNTFNGFVNTTAIHGQRINPSGIPQDFSSAIWGDAYVGTGVLGTSSFHPGVYGKSLQENGIEGYAAANSKAGVYGYANAWNGVGIRGISEGGSGVHGITHDAFKAGVSGESTAVSNSIGVKGVSTYQDSLGIGVYGVTSGKAGDAAGVLGYTGTTGGVGVVGKAPFGIAVRAFNQTANYPAMYGLNSNGGYGIHGHSHEYGYSASTPIGVRGTVQTDQSSGYGVIGINFGSGDGIRGYAGLGGNGISGYDHENGYGRAGLFVVDNTNNFAEVVRMENQGTGTSLVVDANNTMNSANLAVFQNSGTGNYAVFEDGSGINKIRFDSSGKGFFDGGTQTGGADIAEVFDVEGNIDKYEPGDVLAISTENDRTVTKSSTAYSTLVAGVYATKPGVLMTEEQIDADLSGKVPMGVIGVIPTKVCPEGGAIQRGDLLVTSSIPGVAMKGDSDLIRTGQVLGKALENYALQEIGLIRVLVNVK